MEVDALRRWLIAREMVAADAADDADWDLLVCRVIDPADVEAPAVRDRA